jgi:hypothetical protein
MHLIACLFHSVKRCAALSEAYGPK